MSKNLTFKKHFHGLSDADIGALTSRLVFKMRCKSSSVYLVMDRLKIGGPLKKKAKSEAQAARVSKNLSELSIFEDSDIKKVEKTRRLI